jgi:hypothetical protein
LAETYPATALKQTHEQNMIDASNETILAHIIQQHEISPEVEIFNEATIDLKLTKQVTFQGMSKQFKLDPRHKAQQGFRIKLLINTNSIENLTI